MTSRVGKQLAGRMTKIARELQNAGKPAVTKAAGVVKDAADREIKSASGGDSRLSGVGRKGAKVGTRVRIVPKPGGDVDGLIGATGPLHFIENDTKAGPRYRRRNRRRAVAGPVRPAMHPGTKGKHPFARGVEKSRGKAVKVLRDAQRDAMKRGFR